MRHLLALSMGCALVGALLAAPAPPALAQSHVNAGISIGENGVNGFYLGIGDYYHVPERDVLYARERAIPDDEIPVVFFLASRAHCDPNTIVEMRLGGMSWDAITYHFGLGPEIYYYPVQTGEMSPPYGRAYGYYQHHRRSQWRRMHLRDDDIVNLVNLRFISERGHVPASRVMQMRGQGRPFTAIYQESGGNGPRGRQDAGQGDRRSPGRGNWRWKDHDRGRQ